MVLLVAWALVAQASGLWVRQTSSGPVRLHLDGRFPVGKGAVLDRGQNQRIFIFSQQPAEGGHLFQSMFESQYFFQKVLLATM
jgi:hypothetical protein